MTEVIEKKSPSSEKITIKAGNNRKTVSVSTRQLTFIAITGGFRGGSILAKDRTKDVAHNSTTETIFLKAKSISETMGVSFNGIFIQPGSINALSLDLAIDFINKSHDSTNDILLIYGYSNGGDYAMDLARELAKNNVFVNELITIDATDRVGRNISVKTLIPKNVIINHNYCQREDCGIINCARGDANKASDSNVTTVINKEIKEEDIGQKVFHAHMEELVMGDAIKDIRGAIQAK